MKRAERQYALVDLLRGARRPWSAGRLAGEFGVSSRTIERDIGSLQLAGVPIYADHGAAGGYSILREYSLPPLNLSAAESLAVLAGLALLESSPYQGAARRVVRLTYLGADEDDDPDRATSTVRDVETMGLLRAGDAWLLTGWCRLRKAIRGFRIERITRLEILDEVPPPRDPTLLEADLARWPTRRLA